MTALTKDNADIQKIVAFENAFERLLAIIYEEGQSDGGIVVSDCVNLMLNLLRGNASNQVRVPERRAGSGPARPVSSFAHALAVGCPSDLFPRDELLPEAGCALPRAVSRR